MPDLHNMPLKLVKGKKTVKVFLAIINKSLKSISQPNSHLLWEAFCSHIDPDTRPSPFYIHIDSPCTLAQFSNFVITFVLLFNVLFEYSINSTWAENIKFGCTLST